ncbi:TIGR03279 family radical SAM protein [Nodosilinea sp. LEGE 06152]|uniref:TIGR03279 family radical SAM protein n=1 Tax=Nodosilinea sp. LEGE 06152 TaxID=2777966 RepID=UPI00187E26A1|nr:TIGR03279 family radical SAM protein [Nodosilinea sp. LEGE 06152]MBE9159255.1 TIGR03279 family radical SAM protein [Nodosilinea sp. LEGE 06152]
MAALAIRPACITGVLPGSIAEEIGFEPGDALVAINGQKPRDLIDYRFLCADEDLALEVLDRRGKTHHIDIEKDIDEDLGLEFETALFDGLMQCNNACPFCFIDQQPPGKRGTLYLKDDDYRLSFLYGSYLTLTNLLPQEWNRIAQLRLSPLYVSVHATEPEVRSRLLKNARAGQILDQLAWFQEQRLQIHAQVVVCPGINDGDHLETTLRDLAKFHSGDTPAVASAAVVPVGLTRFRPQDDELTPVTQAQARQVIARVQAFQNEFQRSFGTNFVWLADEWFLIAQQPVPAESHYEDYPQIGNGVGSIRQFLKAFEQSAEDYLPEAVNPPRTLTWVVGNAVEHAFQPIVERLNQVQGLTVHLAALASDYWGRDLTVTGLLTGHDLLLGLQHRALGDALLLPTVMLKPSDSGDAKDTLFLDDTSVATVSQRLNCPVLPVDDTNALVRACCGEMPAPQFADLRPAVGYWTPS